MIFNVLIKQVIGLDDTRQVAAWHLMHQDIG